MNSLTLQPTANLGTIQSNQLVPVGNVNANNAQGLIGTNLKGDIPQSGGKKRRRSNNRSNTRSNTSSRSGGSWEAILGQAAVPGVLLAAQQTFRKSRKNKGKY
jgi:hypothetical protein